MLVWSHRKVSAQTYVLPVPLILPELTALWTQTSCCIYAYAAQISRLSKAQQNSLESSLRLFEVLESCWTDLSSVSRAFLAMLPQMQWLSAKLQAWQLEHLVLKDWCVCEGSRTAALQLAAQTQPAAPVQAPTAPAANPVAPHGDTNTMLEQMTGQEQAVPMGTSLFCPCIRSSEHCVQVLNYNELANHVSSDPVSADIPELNSLCLQPLTVLQFGRQW